MSSFYQYIAIVGCNKLLLFDIIAQRVKMNINKKQISAMLHRIKENCQFLTHIKHISQAESMLRGDEIESRQICPSSVSKVVVQMTYLLFTCKILNIDIYITTSPIYHKKYPHRPSQAKLIFYLAEQQKLANNYISATDLKFTYMNSQKFNQNILAHIENLIKSVELHIEQEDQSQNANENSINKFMQFVKTKIQPRLLDGFQVDVIKLLELTDLFIKNSDLLRSFKGSVFYKIKKMEVVIQKIKKEKKKFIANKDYFMQYRSANIFYKVIDDFLTQLLSEQVFYMDKSSSNEQNRKRIFGVGDLVKTKIKDSEFNKYVAQLYTTQKVLIRHPKNGQMIQKTQRNVYLMQYLYEKSIMTVKYITNLQANMDSMDSISNHCSNFAFQNIFLSMEILEAVRNSAQHALPRKYLVFKVNFIHEEFEQPFGKLLVMIQYVTICSKIFLELITKKISRDQIALIKEFTARFNHIYKLFVEKASNFYQNL